MSLSVRLNRISRLHVRHILIGALKCNYLYRMYVAYIMREYNNADDGMRKGKACLYKDKWESCARLAIDWNSSEIARNSIFNTENRSLWQVRCTEQFRCKS